MSNDRAKLLERGLLNRHLGLAAILDACIPAIFSSRRESFVISNKYGTIWVLTELYLTCAMSAQKYMKRNMDFSNNVLGMARWSTLLWIFSTAIGTV